MAKKMPSRLASAHAFWRLAAKAHHSGQYKKSEQYSKRAEKLFREHKRHVEYLASRQTSTTNKEGKMNPEPMPESTVEIGGQVMTQAQFDAARLPLVTREQARDMADAHDEGLHAENPRQFCPECEGRDLSSYPRAESK